MIACKVLILSEPDRPFVQSQLSCSTGLNKTEQQQKSPTIFMALLKYSHKKAVNHSKPDGTEDHHQSIQYHPISSSLKDTVRLQMPS
jgi:hypothetical protein